jgi:hypothetical protein
MICRAEAALLRNRRKSGTPDRDILPTRRYLMRSTPQVVTTGAANWSRLYFPVPTRRSAIGRCDRSGERLGVDSLRSVSRRSQLSKLPRHIENRPHARHVDVAIRNTSRHPPVASSGLANITDRQTTSFSNEDRNDATRDFPDGTSAHLCNESVLRPADRRVEFVRPPRLGSVPKLTERVF